MISKTTDIPKYLKLYIDLENELDSDIIKTIDSQNIYDSKITKTIDS